MKPSTQNTSLPPFRGKARMGVRVLIDASTLTLALSLQGRGDLFQWCKKGFHYE
jgi:hypothetical protein